MKFIDKNLNKLGQRKKKVKKWMIYTINSRRHFKYNERQYIPGIFKYGNPVGTFRFTRKFANVLCKWLTDKGYPTDWKNANNGRKRFYTYDRSNEKVQSIIIGMNGRIQERLAKEFKHEVRSK